MQTSLNLGVMHLTEDGLHFSYSIRSCIASQKAMLAQRVHAIVEFAGGTVSERGNYPGWQYERDSKLRELVLGVYRDLTGAEAKLERRTADWSAGSSLRRFPVSTPSPSGRAARRSFRARAAERALHRARLRAGVRGPAPQQVSRKPCGHK